MLIVLEVLTYGCTEWRINCNTTGSFERWQRRICAEEKQQIFGKTVQLFPTEAWGIFYGVRLELFDLFMLRWSRMADMSLHVSISSVVNYMDME
jgi:hypothetical protein